MTRVFQVLSVGYDSNLMASRSLLLRNAGYAVEEAYSRHQALAMVRSDLHDVLLICHTVPLNERRTLISAVRKQRFLMPVLCVSMSDWSGTEDGCPVVSNTPSELLAAIDSAVKKTSARI